MKYGYETTDAIGYDILKNHAIKNRKLPTDAERCLWSVLRANNLGAHFRRQHPIGDYIVDFVCLKHRLVIEVDGKYHFTPEQMNADQLRTQQLQKLGYKEIRFTNEDIIGNIDSVVKSIKENICDEYI